MNKEKKILEVCAGDIDSVYAAAEGGASRVELCSALGEGGVTPSAGFIREARKVKGLGLNVLIRPRGGDFVYTPQEVDCMVADIEQCRREGADAVVIGALTPEGDIDMDACRRMVDAAKGMSVTFHRAFDMCRDARKGLEDIIALGCDRILTSGQAPSAAQGVEMLAELHRLAAGRIVIMAGAGVNASNAGKILREGLADELHASARAKVESKVTNRRDDVKMGTPDSDEYSRLSTSSEIVKEILKNF